ncbi:MAG: L,D-transpeptidase [Jatrophihabitans sp.]
MSTHRPFRVTVAALLATGLALAGCTSGSGTSKDNGKSGGSSGSTTSGSQSSTSAAPAAPAVLALNPANGAKNINPAVPITATVKDGTISSATLVSSTNTVVKGAVAAAGTSWKSARALGYGKTYTLKVTAKNADGKVVTEASKFTTVTPNNVTMPYLQDTYNTGLVKGGTYGVGMIINIHFDEPITNRAAAEKAISITSTPAVTGAFYWLSNQVVHWRPKAYWKPGTIVTVKANTYGVQLSNGLYGQADKATSFKIGASHVCIASDKTYMVTCRTNGKAVKTMPTAMGQHITIQGKNGPVSLYTPQGTYTVMDHNTSVVMDSASFGVPHSSPYGYKETIYWATRISNGGVFLHELDSTVWAQGHQDISHGCLNLNHTNAVWFYHYSQIGDVVTVTDTNGPTLTVSDGGDWTVSWATWLKGGVNKA